MKKIFKYKALYFIGGLSVLLLSCSTYKSTYRISQVQEKDVVIADKIGVELRIDENKIVQGSSTKRHSSPNDAKDEAYYNAIVNNNIHVIVDPIYKVRTTARILCFGGKSYASVTGFAGYYENPRSYKQIQAEKDAKLLKEKQEQFDLAVKQMKQLKDEGIIKQNTTVTSESKINGIDLLGNVKELSVNSLNIDSEYEVTKNTETSSLVDEYLSYIAGVKNPSSVISDDADKTVVVVEDATTEEKTGFLAGVKLHLMKIVRKIPIINRLPFIKVN